MYVYGPCSFQSPLTFTDLLVPVFTGYQIVNFTKTCTIPHFLSIFCWACISLQILGKNQLDALFYVFIYFMCLHVSSVTALIIRRLNHINTSSGMISLCKWLLGMLVWRVWHTKQSLTQTNHTRWCINTIRSPDDEHLMLESCREMK